MNLSKDLKILYKSTPAAGISNQFCCLPHCSLPFDAAAVQPRSVAAFTLSLVKALIP